MGAKSADCFVFHTYSQSRERKGEKTMFRLRGYDKLSDEFYDIPTPGDGLTDEDATRAAAADRLAKMEQSRPERPDRVFVVRPDGSSYRFEN